MIEIQKKGVFCQISRLVESKKRGIFNEREHQRDVITFVRW